MLRSFARFASILLPDSPFSYSALESFRSSLCSCFASPLIFSSVLDFLATVSD